MSEVNAQKKSFVLYLDYSVYFEAMTAEEAGILIKSIFEYAQKGETSLNIPEKLQLIYIGIIKKMESDAQKYKETCEKNRENAKARVKNKATASDRKRPQATANKRTHSSIDNDYDYDNDYDSDINICSSTDERAPTNEAFLKFWNVYPKKQNKQGALKAWKKIKPNSDLVSTIIHDVERRRRSEEWQKEQGKYIPLPASYINGRRWEDEATEVYSKLCPHIGVGELDDLF